MALPFPGGGFLRKPVAPRVQQCYLNGFKVPRLYCFLRYIPGRKPLERGSLLIGPTLTQP